MKNHQHNVQNSDSGKYLESHIKMTKYRSIFLTEDVTNEVGADLSAMLLYFDALNDDEITLYIHTNGGDVAGLSNIYDIMQIIKSPIKTVCLGKAYSAGAVLLAAGTPGRRFAFKNSNIMIHGLQAAFPIPGDDLINSKNYYEFLESNNASLMKILAYHTNHTLEKVLKDCEQDQYMTPKEAKDYGIIDGILG